MEKQKAFKPEVTLNEAIEQLKKDNCKEITRVIIRDNSEIVFSYN